MDLSRQLTRGTIRRVGPLVKSDEIWMGSRGRQIGLGLAAEPEKSGQVRGYEGRPDFVREVYVREIIK